MENQHTASHLRQANGYQSSMNSCSPNMPHPLTKEGLPGNLGKNALHYSYYFIIVIFGFIIYAEFLKITLTCVLNF